MIGVVSGTLTRSPPLAFGYEWGPYANKLCKAVGKGGKSLWIDCRKPAAIGCGKSRYPAVYERARNAPAGCGQKVDICRGNAGQNERDRALGAPGPKMHPEMGGYFSELLMVSKFELSLVPRPFTAVMIAIEIPAAIRPYSMAVAPDSSLRNDLMSRFHDCSDLGLCCLEPRVPPQFLPGTYGHKSKVVLTRQRSTFPNIAK